MRLSLRAHAALLVTSALSTPALAQEYVPPTAPPIRETIDGNGVDLTRGALVGATHSVSIGGPGELGLSWSRTIVSDGSFRDSTAMYLLASGSTYYVTIGNRTESFTLSGTNYISDQKTGATLVSNSGGYTYTSRDGAIYTFVGWQAVKKQYGGTARVTTITTPTGQKLTFNYEVVSGVCIPRNTDPCYQQTTGERLISVESNNGYKLKFDFDVEQPTPVDPPAGWAEIKTVTALNMAVDPTTQSWPTLNMSGVGSVTDSLARTTTYTFTSGALTGIKRPGATSNNVAITYAGGKVSQVVNEGVTTNYAWSDLGNVRTATISDAVPGHRVVKTDLTTMLVKSDTNEAGKTTSYLYYSGSGLLQTVTAHEGNKADFQYDQRGNVTATTLTAKSGSPPATITTTTSYLPSDGIESWRCASSVAAAVCNKPIASKDALNNQTDYAWDAVTGLLTSVTLPAPATGGIRPQTRYSYSNYYGQYLNGSGPPVPFATPVTRLTGISQCQQLQWNPTTQSCTDNAHDEVKTTITYGSSDTSKGPIIYGTANALPSSVTTAAGDSSVATWQSFTWDAVGNRLSVEGPLGDTALALYDADREVVGRIGPDPDASGSLQPRASRLTYNADGQVTKAEAGTVTSQSNWASFVRQQELDYGYDANARNTTVALSDGTTTYALTQTSYDSLGRVDCTAQRMNTATFASLPSSACSLATEGSDGPDRITRVDYDPVSRPTKRTVAYGISNEQADERTLTYTANGQVATLADAVGNLTTVQYDEFDRPSKMLYPTKLPKGAGTSNSSDFEQLTYDANSNVKTFRNRTAQTTTFIYDNLNRPTFKDLPTPEPDITYAYDNLGRMLSASQTGSPLSFTWDALGRNLTQASSLGTVTSTYDVGGRRTQIMHPDAAHFTYSYDMLGNLTGVYEGPTTATPLQTFGYGNDWLPQWRADAGFTAVSYSWDPVGRLTSRTDGFTDIASNTTSSFTYNPASQINSTMRSNDAYAWTGHVSGSTAYTQNGLNQQVSIGSVAATYDDNGNFKSDGSWTYTYDSENRLVHAVGPPGKDVTLGYDPLGRLSYFGGTGVTSVNFLYDGDALIAEYNPGTGQMTQRYVHGPGDDNPLVWYIGAAVGSTNRRNFHADELGSIIATSSGSGAMASINSYDEYGKPGAGNTSRFGYTGQMWLNEIGLYHYKARAYSPEFGRFMQPDPMGYGGGMNLYAYVGNDPVNLVDPSGLFESTSTGRIFVDGCGAIFADIISPKCASSGVPPGTYDVNRMFLDLGAVLTFWNPGLGGGGIAGGGSPQVAVTRTPNAKPVRHCYGPPSGPPGVSPSDVAKQLKANGNLAASHSPTDLGWFYQQTRNRGPWDYKQYSRSYQNLGNYNYGYAGTRQGIPGEVLLEVAGLVQLVARTSDWSFITSNWDDPSDQEQIRRGINDAQNQCY